MQFSQFLIPKLFIRDLLYNYFSKVGEKLSRNGQKSGIPATNDPNWSARPGNSYSSGERAGSRARGLFYG